MHRIAAVNVRRNDTWAMENGDTPRVRVIDQLVPNRSPACKSLRRPWATDVRIVNISCPSSFILYFRPLWTLYSLPGLQSAFWWDWQFVCCGDVIGYVGQLSMEFNQSWYCLMKQQSARVMIWNFQRRKQTNPEQTRIKLCIYETRAQ